MDREEVLKQTQAQAGDLDEREQQMLGEAFGFGGVLMTLLCAALAAARLVQGLGAYDYAAIVFAYLAGTHARQFWKTRRRGNLLMAAASAVVLAANLILLWTR